MADTNLNRRRQTLRTLGALVFARSAFALDLDEYFERIGHRSGSVPGVENLYSLAECHPQAIPFENLDSFVGATAELDIGSLVRKLVRSERGGDGFEHNLLLRHVLRAMGYRVECLSANVLRAEPHSCSWARGHLILNVEAEGTQFIVDAGFGAPTPTAPLRLVMGVEQSTPHEIYRLLPRGDDFLLQVKRSVGWRALYRFGLGEPRLPVGDPDVDGTATDLIVTRRAPRGHYVLHNTELSVHDTSGGFDRRVLSTTAELRGVLADCFRLQAPASPSVERAFASLFR